MMSTFKCRILICREFQSSIKQSNHRVLKDVILKHKLEDVFQVTDYEIRCAETGSNIIFAGLHHNLDNIRSIEGVDICVVNEAQSVSEDSIDTLIPTIMRNKNAIIIYSLNPRFKTDVIWTRFIDQEREDTKVIAINLSDNRFADHSLLEISDQLKQSDFDRWRWIYGGECLGEEAMSLIKAHEIEASRKRELIRDEKLPILAGLDVSGLGKDWSVLIRRRGNEILSIDKMHKGDTKEVTAWAQEIFFTKGFDKIAIDASGSTGVFDNMRQWSNATNQIQVLKFLGGSKAKRTELYSNKRTECYCLFRDWIRESGVLTSDSFWDGLPNQLWTPTQGEQIKLNSKKELKTSPDEWDAISMTFALVGTIAKKDIEFTMEDILDGKTRRTKSNRVTWN